MTTMTTTNAEGGNMGELVRYVLRGFLGFGGPVALVGRFSRLGCSSGSSEE
ncbi:hypothetical protein [Bradyrhizobium sp. RP6]|uniref:hypothetical protein n=1 Tax=Bradyrhizobium sp. RP6 TaxID=2489596 RepID=UPI0013159488|nr:hypothetical protein [Bradyrhizobium sp. RP6]